MAIVCYVFKEATKKLWHKKKRKQNLFWPEMLLEIYVVFRCLNNLRRALSAIFSWSASLIQYFLLKPSFYGYTTEKPHALCSCPVPKIKLH